MADPPRSPFRESFGGWVLGSSGFVERLRALAGPVPPDRPLREARELAAPDAGVILAAVRAYYDLDAGALRRRHDRHIARAMAAWLCRRHTEATLRELAGPLGLSRGDSVPGLVRRLETRLKGSGRLRRDVAGIEQMLSAAGAKGEMTAASPPTSRRPTPKPRK